MSALIGVTVAAGLLGCAVISVVWAVVTLLLFLGYTFAGLWKKARAGK